MDHFLYEVVDSKVISMRKPVLRINAVILGSRIFLFDKNLPPLVGEGPV